VLGVRIPPGLFIVGIVMNGVFSFISEVKAELKKVSWPQKNELIGSIIIVCLLSMVFAGILGSMDFLFNSVVKYIIF
jgi:preprotein translocase subunit SecE